MQDKEKYKHKDGSGSLFKNKYKDTETKPDYKGTCTDPSGKIWELAGWASKTNEGESRPGHFRGVAPQRSTLHLSGEIQTDHFTQRVQAFTALLCVQGIGQLDFRWLKINITFAPHAFSYSWEKFRCRDASRILFMFFNYNPITVI